MTRLDEVEVKWYIIYEYLGFRKIWVVVCLDVERETYAVFYEA